MGDRIPVDKGVFVGATGAVENATVHKGRNGPYVAARLVVATGDWYECRWWDSKAGPKDDETVAIHGRGWKDGLITITHTESLGSHDVPPEHRLIDYYRACLDAEHRAADGYTENDPLVLTLGTSDSPFARREINLPEGSKAARWMVDRQVGGITEMIVVSWPVVRNGGRVHPLLTAEAALQLDSRRLLITGVVELDETGLEAVGFGHEERQQLRHDFNADGRDDRSAAALELLQATQVNNSTGSSHDFSNISFEALAFALREKGSQFTHYLFNDLEKLKSKDPATLRSGPLGTLLGHVIPEAYPPPRPSPSPLPSNIEQERAITAGMNCTLTLVTGPPGTGKSQVLANTVAASLSRGESVLLASKNNHAVDVVCDRLLRIHPDIHVHRLGKKSLLVEAASKLGSALSKPALTDSGLEDAKAVWSATKDSAMAPYRGVARRGELECQIASADQEIAQLQKVLAADLGARIGVSESVDTGFLVDAHRKASRSLEEADRAPNRWWWQRRSKRRVAALADDSVKTCIDLSGQEHRSSLLSIFMDEGPHKVLSVVTMLVAMAGCQQRLLSLREEHRLLPDDEAAQSLIKESFSNRIDPAKELFAANMRDRMYRLGAPGIAAALSYQAKLAAGATGPAREAAAAAIPAVPVWAVTSLGAGSALPMNPGMFDLVIIDEATQSDIPSAIPLLYRAKRAMVIGDPQQLTHITTISAKVDSQIAARHQVESGVHVELAYKGVSLFAAVASRSTAAPIMLRRHFRSHPDIIGFSNKEFYGSQLIVETDIGALLPGVAAEWCHVSGRFEPGTGGRSGRNVPEAHAVISTAIEIVSELSGTDHTVGIVSPLRPQVDLIRELITRDHTKLAQQLTIDTAHGFQGDERDVMIMSPVITAGMPNYLVRFAGTPNVINVAVTRPRSRLVVVGDRPYCLQSGTVLSLLADYLDNG